MSMPRPSGLPVEEVAGAPLPVPSTVAAPLEAASSADSSEVVVVVVVEARARVLPLLVAPPLAAPTPPLAGYVFASDS